MNQVSWIHIKEASTPLRPFMWRDKTQVGKIEEGWLLKFKHFHGRASAKSTQAMVFIPDPDHIWNPESDNNKWEWIQKKGTPNDGDYLKRLNVNVGWVYLSCYFTEAAMHVSLQYVGKQSKGASGDT
jgi:hypothetical protein